MPENNETELFVQEAPPLNQEEMDSINALFPAYIFRRSCTNEIWTTCCHQHMTVSDEDMMVVIPERNFPAIMWEPHQREQKNRWDDVPKPTVQCPLCGEKVIVKELRYTGRRDNLSRYRRAAVVNGKIKYTNFRHRKDTNPRHKRGQISPRSIPGQPKAAIW